MTFQCGGFFLCGRVWEKEGRWGFLACTGDERGLQELPRDVLKLQIQLCEQETTVDAYIKFRFWSCYIVSLVSKA